ncbi:MAG: DEAD/DEAH box helicase [Clostridia bacterium]
MGALFTDINLSQEMIKAIEAMNYKEMTDIQARAIPIIMEGHDVIGRSSTGTGKTAAFGIPAIESVTDFTTNKPQVLILAPTRELACQISEELKKFSKFKQNLGIATVYGGESIDIQIRQLKKSKIVVGTPGRLMDHIRRKTLKLDEIKMVILDEADEMLNMGFLEDIQSILTTVPDSRQTLLFSATMPPAILRITKEFQNEPEMVAVDHGQRTLDTITQYYYQVPQARKMDAVNLILQSAFAKRSIIFCNTKRMVDDMVEYLNDHHFKVAGIHGDMKQSARTNVMKDFKTGRIMALIATDVAARGIDVDDIEMVINFDIPLEIEYYIHRIGRTGRAGKTGSSHTLVCNRMQLRKIKEVAAYVKSDITEANVPSVEDIGARKIEKFMVKVRKNLDDYAPDQYVKYIDKLIEDGYTLEVIAPALLRMVGHKERKTLLEVNNINKTDFKASAPSAGRNNNGFRANTNGRPSFSNNSEKRAYPSAIGRTTLRVNIGRNKRVAPNFIVGAVVEGSGLEARAIGKIDIYNDYTTLQLKPNDAKILLDKMQSYKIKGINVEFSEAPASAPASDRPNQAFNKPPRRKY